MRKRARARRTGGPLTYANVMATIAVFGVLAGGGAYAASKIGPNDIAKNAVRAKHIKKKQVKARHLAKNAIRPKCPAGTALHELACIELTPRAQADWYDAFDACDQAQRRLVTLGELQTFRFRADLDAPTAGSEWADGALSDDAGSVREATYLTMNLGIPDLAAITAEFQYRCVVPATVG